MNQQQREKHQAELRGLVSKIRELNIAIRALEEKRDVLSLKKQQLEILLKK